MVNFMYTGAYQVPQRESTDKQSLILFHVRMTALADKYLIPSL